MHIYLDSLMFLLLLRKKQSSSFAGRSMCSNPFFRFLNMGLFLTFSPLFFLFFPFLLCVCALTQALLLLLSTRILCLVVAKCTCLVSYLFIISILFIFVFRTVLVKTYTSEQVFMWMEWMQIKTVLNNTQMGRGVPYGDSIHLYEHGMCVYCYEV